jgi:3-phenylpropionate/cinnamic acid dioxygenase small subunit
LTRTIEAERVSPNRVEDELAIRNLIAALALLADSGTVEEYVALFADDARWEMPANPANGVAASARVGRAEIAAGVRDRRAAGVQGPGSNTRHVITTVHVEVTGADTAAAQAYFLYFSNTADGPTVTSIGRYADSFVRTAAGWKLAKRRIVLG